MSHKPAIFFKLYLRAYYAYAICIYMEFEWHDNKAKANFKKHAVTFEEAMSCFYDPHQVAFYDPDHSADEDREIMIAHSEKTRVLLVYIHNSR
jgi:uncharacterized DUF497 family protein